MAMTLEQKRERARNYMRARRAALPSHICPVCLTREKISGQGWCGVCAEGHTASALRTAKRRIRKGKCRDCGKREPVDIGTFCAPCAKKRLARYHRNKHRWSRNAAP